MTLSQLRSHETGIALAFLGAFLIWETAAPFFPFFKKNAAARTWHGVRNALLGLLNVLLIAGLFLGLWFQAAQWAGRHQWGLLFWLGIEGWPRALLALVLLDLAFYFWHRCNHETPFLWRFHRTHHSDARVDVTTASRFHLGEVFFESWLKMGLIVLFGLRLEELFLYHLAAFAVSQFHHANIVLTEPLDRALRVLLSTPSMHKVHHSSWQPETDSNYSALFSVWDRLFGTFRLAPNLRALNFGLEDYRGADEDNLGALLQTPWRNSARGRTSAAERATYPPS